MRVYYHPSVGEYTRYDSFEIDHATLAGVPSGIVTGIVGIALKRTGHEVVLASGVVGGLMAGVFGKFYPKKILSWFNPPPFDTPLQYPRQIPNAVVSSYIGDSGQVLNLLMYEGAGSIVKDHSGKNNHGKIYGAVWVDGSFGWALSFSGKEKEHVDCGNGSSLNINPPLTYEAWIYPKSFDTALALYILAKLDTDNKKGIGLGIMGTYDPANKGKVIINNGSFSIYSATPLSVNKWYHLVATNDGKTTRIYINGVLSTSGAQSIVNDPNHNLWVGNRPDVPTRTFNGLIACARVYNRALTAEEVKQHFNSTRSIFGV
jgi:hypothetical protein